MNTHTQYRVLCIDDNPVLHKLMEVLFGRRTDFHLMSATSATEGLNQARTKHPDIIFMDISMPLIDGFEALSLLKADPTTESIPVVALSSRSASEDVRRGLEAGFAEYITKPTDLSTLMRTMAQVLRIDDALS